MAGGVESAHPADEERVPHGGWWAAVAGALAGLALRLAFWGKPGEVLSAMLDSFIFGSPILVGVVTAYMAERIQRRSLGYHFVAGMLASLLYVFGTLIVLIEGWICAILIIPLFSLVGGLAALVMGLVCRATNWPRHGIVSCAALLPLLGGALEPLIPSAASLREQRREAWIPAPPERVWRELVGVREFSPGEVDAWMYRIGVPLPLRVVRQARDGELVRRVSLTKGSSFEQMAVEQRENELIRWRYHFDESSFPAGALDDHVRVGGEYFDLSESVYQLQSENGGTRLVIRMRYRVSTHFNWYAGRIADFLIGDFAERTIALYSRRATSDTRNER